MRKKEIWYPLGRPAIQQTDNDINEVELLKDFVVIDDEGTEWIAKEGLISDGESSPEMFEWLAGDPFAAVSLPGVIIHDYYCKTKEKPQQDTHKILYKLWCHEIKHNKEFGWVLALPWNNKAWHYSRAWVKWRLVVRYQRIKNPDWQ